MNTVLKLAYSPTLTLLNSLVAVYKIYVLKDPFTDEVFYVGQTQQELNIRLSGHLNESRAINPNKRAKFDEIIANGGKPSIEAVETINGTCYVDKLHVNARELHWIRFYRAKQARLTNGSLMTDASESKDYKNYLKSIKEGQGQYRYYFCGVTPGGHEVYDENRMRADGFRLPDLPPEPIKIVEKIIERPVFGYPEFDMLDGLGMSFECQLQNAFIERLKQYGVNLETILEQPAWSPEFSSEISMTNYFLEDLEIDDWDFESEDENDESDYEPDNEEEDDECAEIANS